MGMILKLWESQEIKLKSEDQIWESQRLDTNSRFTQIYPEDSVGGPESSSPANLMDAITTGSMARELEKKDQAQVQRDGNWEQVKENETKKGK
uniref:Uncharacterized protein n=1 Tax=Romanomermis culicivorax TaxID=13658 RepID=A0A915L382_ROMCU